MVWTELVGKKIKILFDDNGKVLIKIGVLKDTDDKYVRLISDTRDELIPHSKIVRCEVL